METNPDDLGSLEATLKQLSGTIDKRIEELGKQKEALGKQLESIASTLAGRPPPEMPARAQAAQAPTEQISQRTYARVHAALDTEHRRLRRAVHAFSYVYTAVATRSNDILPPVRELLEYVEKLSTLDTLCQRIEKRFHAYRDDSRLNVHPLYASLSEASNNVSWYNMIPWCVIENKPVTRHIAQISRDRDKDEAQLWKQFLANLPATHWYNSSSYKMQMERHHKQLCTLLDRALQPKQTFIDYVKSLFS